LERRIIFNFNKIQKFLLLKQLLKKNIYLKLGIDLFLIYLIVHFSSNVAFHHQNSLYFQTVLESNFLVYRYPPATYFFPDFIIYLFINLLNFETWQTINLAGISLFIISLYLSFLLIGKTGSLFIFLIALLISDLVPLRLMYHFGIISLSFLYIVVLDRKIRFFILSISIISDPLFVIFWIVIPIIYPKKTYDYREILTVILSLLISMFLNETSIAFILLFFTTALILIPIIFLKFFKNGLLLKNPYKNFIIACGIIFLIIITLYDRQLDRYVIPLIISVLLALFYNKNKSINYFDKKSFLYLAIIFVSILVFRFDNIFFGENERQFALYECAISEIDKYKINEISTTDSHTKSLFLASKIKESNVSVVQIDAHNNILDTWISPYKTHLNRSDYLLTKKDFCKVQDNTCINPNGVKFQFNKIIEICDNFFLINTVSKLPINSYTNFGNNIFQIKFNRLFYNFKINYSKALGKTKR
tara:strand:- start:681 stop:2105 length:1425 start_codon:yes stop_codon:yes gene_type:complete